jgi:hypothetical protein
VTGSRRRGGISPLRAEARRAIVSFEQMVYLEFAERLEPLVGGNVEFVSTGEHKGAGDHSHLFTIGSTS